MSDDETHSALGLASVWSLLHHFIPHILPRGDLPLSLFQWLDFGVLLRRQRALFFCNTNQTLWLFPDRVFFFQHCLYRLLLAVSEKKRQHCRVRDERFNYYVDEMITA